MKLLQANRIGNLTLKNSMATAPMTRGRGEGDSANAGVPLKN